MNQRLILVLVTLAIFFQFSIPVAQSKDEMGLESILEELASLKQENKALKDKLAEKQGGKLKTRDLNNQSIDSAAPELESGLNSELSPEQLKTLMEAVHSLKLQRNEMQKFLKELDKEL